jgi:hypothetical protein
MAFKFYRFVAVFDRSGMGPPGSQLTTRELYERPHPIHGLRDHPGNRWPGVDLLLEPAPQEITTRFQAQFLKFRITNRKGGSQTIPVGGLWVRPFFKL